MRMDLEKKEYDTVEEYKKYIYGSADAVGLMCLRVFVDGSENLYNELSPFAISLGSAFQKVNFLRDIKDDSNILNWIWFLWSVIAVFKPQIPAPIIPTLYIKKSNYDYK